MGSKLFFYLFKKKIIYLLVSLLILTITVQIVDLIELTRSNIGKEKFSFESWKDSLLKIHNPKSIKDLIKNNIYRKRLAYDEFLAHQLAVAIVRKLNQKKRGINLWKKLYLKLIKSFFSPITIKIKVESLEIY